MSRTIAFAVLIGALSSTAIAAPQRQLVAPNFNPGLRTVPFVHQSHGATDDAACAQQLVSRVDSGTVIAGPNGRVVHITGMADAGVSVAELAITSISTDGRSATADFLVCTSPTWVSASPVSAVMPLNAHAGVESIAVRTQSNAITLKVR
ncbi:MAG: hypothetical protein HOP13_11315 [Alphaproteobacteria bacterium]|nr:hypothetical protein [Alphaproteobacteria bacterium]